MSVSALCQACGLCCRGALFRWARLDEAEARRLQARGLAVGRRRDGQHALRLGCAALRGTVCGLYAERPRACDAYFCALAFAVRDGRLAPEDARRTVEGAQALLAEVEASLPPPAEDDPPSLLERAHLRGLRDGPEPLRRAEAFLREHFLGPDRP